MEQLASCNLREFPATMFSRTQNDNGSYNTRCLDCFMTIASCVETEEELKTRESRHICPERALSELLAAELNTPEKRIEAKAQLN
jgi:hypothetical protein